MQDPIREGRDRRTLPSGGEIRSTEIIHYGHARRARNSRRRTDLYAAFARIAVMVKHGLAMATDRCEGLSRHVQAAQKVARAASEMLTKGLICLGELREGPSTRSARALLQGRRHRRARAVQHFRLARRAAAAHAHERKIDAVGRSATLHAEQQPRQFTAVLLGPGHAPTA